ncbi:MAG: hypothetical protein ABR577_16310 [Pyrinomonadaceae bacterium]
MAQQKRPAKRDKLPSAEDNLPTNALVSEVRVGARATANEKFARVAFAFRLIGMTCTFHTTDDNKDHDTSVQIIVDNHVVLMGTTFAGGGQEWDDGSVNSVGVPIANAITWEQGEHGKLTVTIHPNGDDEWHFHVVLDMHYEGNGFRRRVWNNQNLAEDRRTATLNW